MPTILFSSAYSIFLWIVVYALDLIPKVTVLFYSIVQVKNKRLNKRISSSKAQIRSFLNLIRVFLPSSSNDDGLTRIISSTIWELLRDLTFFNISIALSSSINLLLIINRFLHNFQKLFRFRSFPNPYQIGLIFPYDNQRYQKAQ